MFLQEVHPHEAPAPRIDMLARLGGDEFAVVFR